MSYRLAIGLIIFMGVLLLVERHIRADLTAALGVQTVLQPTPTEFPIPTSVTWRGRILRSFVSGHAFEVESAAAPGGLFHAYGDEQSPAMLSSGSAAITGLWTGWTCDYGPRCVPEVQIQSIVSTP
jgi:hypothetical protein